MVREDEQRERHASFAALYRCLLLRPRDGRLMMRACCRSRRRVRLSHGASLAREDAFRAKMDFCYYYATLSCLSTLMASC